MVTVVIPTYNSSQYVEKAIKSVLNQTYKNIELLIVDDCSTDNTIDVLNKYVDGNNVRIIRNKENVGVGISRKIGINNAKGKYITFLDSDDYLLEDFIEMNVKLIEEQDADVVYTSIGIFSPTKQFKIINAIDSMAEGDGTLNIFFWCKMNFLTGKLFKTDLVKKCKWSERRVAEDVQTMFYIMYEAKKVMSFSYLGYIHQCRENSLMGYFKDDENDKMNHMFHNFCYNSIAEKEMLEFLIEKNDKTILKQMYEEYFNKVKKTREFIKNKTLPTETYLKYKDLWDEVDNFYPKD